MFVGREPIFFSHPEEIGQHHHNIRGDDYNGKLSKRIYLDHVRKLLLKDFHNSTREDIQRCLFFQKTLQLMRDDQLIYKGCPPDTIKMKETQDAALPFIIAEYELRSLYNVIQNNYNFNVYRHYAAEPTCKNFFIAFVTLLLQFGIILAPLTELEVKYIYPSPIKIVIVTGLVGYLCSHLVLEFKQIRMTMQLYSGLGVFMDIVVNFILTLCIVVVQVLIMLHSEGMLELVADSCALMFIITIDDEIMNLNEEQEYESIAKAIGTILWNHAQLYIHGERDPKEYIREKVHSYYVEHRPGGAPDQHVLEDQISATVVMNNNIICIIKSENEINNKITASRTGPGASSWRDWETQDNMIDISDGGVFFCSDRENGWGHECLGKVRKQPNFESTYVTELKKGKVKVIGTHNGGVFYSAYFIVELEQKDDEQKDDEQKDDEQKDEQKDDEQKDDEQKELINLSLSEL